MSKSARCCFHPWSYGNDRERGFDHGCRDLGCGHGFGLYLDRGFGLYCCGLDCDRYVDRDFGFDLCIDLDFGFDLDLNSDRGPGSDCGVGYDRRSQCQREGWIGDCPGWSGTRLSQC